MGTIADKLLYLNETKTAIKDAIVARGVDVSDLTPFRQYADKIGAIKDTKYGVTIDNLFGNIDEGGTYRQGTEPFVFSLPGAKEIPSASFYGRFYYNKGLTAAYFPDLETISGGSACYYMFLGCSNLTTVSVPKLKSVIGGAALLSALSNIAVTEIDLPELEEVNANSALQYMCAGNSKMTRFSVPKLRVLNGTGICKYMLQYCYALTRLDFPSLTTISSLDSFEYMLRDDRNLTEVHFRADMQATIEAMNQYSSKFGAGANCTFYFDL